jgi:DNA-directed RNA polymerase delta subunit
MQEDIQINLADRDVDSEELDWLLKEWQKEPKPQTIIEIARIYLAHQWQVQTSFLPYESSKSYKVRDKIVVRLKGKNEPAEVVKVSENVTHKDCFTCDIIDVRLLSHTAVLYGQERKSYIANDQAQKWAHAKVESFEVITEKNIADVIPKLLLALENDKRVVNFCEYWLPSEMLLHDISNKNNIIDVRKIIARNKQPLSTFDILNELYPDSKKEEFTERLQFSLNYFLEKDRKFIKLIKPTMKWYLREPVKRILLNIGRGALLNDKMLKSSDLDLMLLYNGFVSQCTFSFPNNLKITAYHDISEDYISGEEFISELTKVSQNKKHEVEFINPEIRGDPIGVRTPSPTPSEKRHWTVTIKPEWLEEGVLEVPLGLSTHIGNTDTIHVIYDTSDEILPYDHNNRLIKGLANYFTKKAIAEWDKVHLLLQDIGPVKLFLNCRWQRRLDRLLKIEPTDLKWEKISLRDCVIVVLAKFRSPAHYREIYTEIAFHKHVSLGSVIGTLSRYCPSVFVHVGRGKWGLAGCWVEQKIPPGHGPEEIPETPGISNEVWEAVKTIEENDYVYKLLQRIKKPLSFDEICSRLADYLKINVEELRATGFLKADDERLRRLDDGTWALEEWFLLPPTVKTEKPCMFRLTLAILTFLFIVITIGVILFWLVT